MRAIQSWPTKEEKEAKEARSRERRPKVLEDADVAESPAVVESPESPERVAAERSENLESPERVAEESPENLEKEGRVDVAEGKKYFLLF